MDLLAVRVALAFPERLASNEEVIPCRQSIARAAGQDEQPIDISIELNIECKREA